MVLGEVEGVLLVGKLRPEYQNQPFEHFGAAVGRSWRSGEPFWRDYDEIVADAKVVLSSWGILMPLAAKVKFRHAKIFVEFRRLCLRWEA